MSEQLTDLIAAHDGYGYVPGYPPIYYCMGDDCKAKFSAPREWAEHLVAVLAETHAVIELPNPDGTGRWKSRRGNKDDGYISWSVGVNGGIPHVRAHRGAGDALRAVADHIAFAAAILAAAAAADEPKVEP